MRKKTLHRRRIKTDEKAKVVAVVWGTYLNAALTIKGSVSRDFRPPVFS